MFRIETLYWLPENDMVLPSLEMDTDSVRAPSGSSVKLLLGVGTREF